MQNKVKLVNHRGLHARASAKFVECARGFDAQINVSKAGAEYEAVAATSIMGLMMLAASFGDTLILTASGAEADSSIEALTNLINEKFGED